MIFNDNIKSVLQLMQAFPSESACIEHLEQIRWSETGVISPFDPASKVYKCKGNKYQCKNTGKYFNVRTGTMFDNTKIPLQKWFLAIWLVTAHKKGVSSLQLSRDLDITQKSAWFMLQRIRNCFGFEGGVSGTVEVDETYMGGDNVNKSNTKRKELHANGAKTGYDHKVPVLGLLEREGKLKAMVLEKSPTVATLQPILFNEIAASSVVITDGHGAYRGINKVFEAHEVVLHTKDQYVRGIYHTNCIENFWSLLKRGIDGIYHQVSRKHLQKYVDEFAFRYNSRKVSDCIRFNMLLNSCATKTTYKELVHG